MIVTGLAIPIMYLLAKRKLAIAARLGSRALRADAVEAVVTKGLEAAQNAFHAT